MHYMEALAGKKTENIDSFQSHPQSQYNSNQVPKGTFVEYPWQYMHANSSEESESKHNYTIRYQIYYVKSQGSNRVLEQ